MPAGNPGNTAVNQNTTQACTITPLPAMDEINQLARTADLYLQKMFKAHGEGRHQDEKFYLQEAADLIVSKIPRHHQYRHARGDYKWHKWHTEKHEFIKDTGLHRLEVLNAAAELPTPPPTPFNDTTVHYLQRSPSTSTVAQPSELDVQSAPSEASSATVLPDHGAVRFSIPQQQTTPIAAAPCAQQAVGSCTPSRRNVAQQSSHVGRMFRPASPRGSAARVQPPTTAAACPRGVYQTYRPDWLPEVHADNSTQRDVKCRKHSIIGQPHDTDMCKLVAEVEAEDQAAHDAAAQEHGEDQAAPQQQTGRSSEWKSKVARFLPKRKSR